MSQLKFWNKQNNNNNNNNNSNTNNSQDNNNNNNGNNNGTTTENGKNGKRNWLHTPDALVNGHVVYLVKFFGNLPVEHPKGIEVVKDAIRKLQFAQQMKKAETGTQEKFKKVEITISVDGVAVQEPRTQKILHQFPLHNISYCADEKGVKKFFSFIAKNVKPVDGSGNVTTMHNTGGSISSNGTNSEDTHECFVFISNKLASDITLTIGQAFELAYRKYINSAEKTDLGKAQQQITDLEKSITIYKDRLRELSLKLSKTELDTILFKMGINDILDVPSDGNSVNGNTGKLVIEDKLLIDTNSNRSSSLKSSPLNSSTMSAYVPIVPPRTNIPSQMKSSNSQKMEELLLNSDSDSDFDPRADEIMDSSGNTSNSNSNNNNNNSNKSNDICNDNLFGFEPSKTCGQQLLFNNNDNKLLNNNNNNNNNNSNNINGGNLISNNSFTNEFNNMVTPPLLAPPPKVAAPRRSTSVTNNINTIMNNGLTNGTTDLFGSDPFDINGPTLFKSKMAPISVDDFSLESLDPLRK